MCTGYFGLLSPGFPVVNVPLQTKRSDKIGGFGIRGFVEFCKETVEKFSTTHPWRWFDWTWKIDVNNLRH
jgi:hypothetical protein